MASVDNENPSGIVTSHEQRKMGQDPSRESEGENDSIASDLPQKQQQVSLNKDYQIVAQLLGKLDAQSKTISEKMKQIVETAPVHDGLTALWEEQAEVHHAASRQNPGTAATSAQASNTDYMIDDETIDDSDDQILLL